MKPHIHNRTTEKFPTNIVSTPEVGEAENVKAFWGIDSCSTCLVSCSIGPQKPPWQQEGKAQLLAERKYTQKSMFLNGRKSMEIMLLRTIKSELSLHLFRGGMRVFCLHLEKLFNDQQRVFFVQSRFKETAAKVSWSGITGGCREFLKWFSEILCKSFRIPKNSWSFDTATWLWYRK